MSTLALSQSPKTENNPKQQVSGSTNRGAPRQWDSPKDKKEQTMYIYMWLYICVTLSVTTYVTMYTYGTNYLQARQPE